MNPLQTKPPLNKGLLLQCLLLSIVILLVDISLPLGVAGAVLHVVVVLLALRARDARYPIGFALLGSFLALLGLMLSDPMGVPWMVYTNRGMALLAIWATALLGLRLKRYQSRLSESEGRFQVMADNAPLMIWRSDRQGAWDFISRGWLDFTGRTLAAEQGKGWLAGVHDQDREHAVASYEACIAGQRRFELECRVRTADGSCRWILLQGVPRNMPGDDFSGLIGTALDIDQRVETEMKLEETRQKYYHREKMAMIGTLAGGMLHEIGNPTASISSLIQGALSECGQPADKTGESRPLYATLLEIQHQVERITQANLDIMNFTRLQDSKIDIHDFNQLIDRTCRLISHDDRMRSIKLELDLDAALPAVEVVPDNIIQLLFNLIENSIVACEGRQESAIKIATRAVGRGVRLSVGDNGSGMSPDTLERARDVFFSTHPEKEDSGLGLALCKVIAEEYNGNIEIESELGKGTAVHVVLYCAVDI
jgi:PAS domain S-box-containing protein